MKDAKHHGRKAANSHTRDGSGRKKPNPNPRGRPREVNRKKKPKYQLQLPQSFPFKITGLILEDLRCNFVPSEYDNLQNCLTEKSYPSWDKITEQYSLRNMSGICALTPPSRVAAQRQVAAILDDIALPGEDIARRDAALAVVKSCEESCRSYNQGGYRALETSKYLPLMQEFCLKVLGSDLPKGDQLVDGARHGPGAVFSQSLPNGISEYQKYSEWPYSVTQDALPYAVEMITESPLWWGALEASYRVSKGLTPLDILDMRRFWDDVFVIVPGNRITTVPKDRKKDRPIAIEPTMNMYLQLGVDGFIRKRLRRKFNIDINNQIPNQQLARSGSFDPTIMAPATIDLSAASDKISRKLIELILPPMWTDLVLDLASKQGELPQGDVIPYEKLSSMGNGYTFALETLVFGAAVYAATRAQNLSWYNMPIAVFGDDIIVPQLLVHDVIYVLETSGLSINQKKSFTSGHVKESCGTDWFRAYPVRPVYLNTIPSNLPELFHIYNTLFMWSNLHSMPLDKTLAYLLRIIGHFGGDHFYGPPSDVTDSYWFNPESTTAYGIRKVCLDKAPTDFFFGKLVGLPRKSMPDRLWRPLHEATRDVDGSAFIDSHPRRWKYMVYNSWPEETARVQERDYIREYHYYRTS